VLENEYNRHLAQTGVECFNNSNIIGKIMAS